MIAACAVYFLVNGSYEPHIATGKVIQMMGSYVVVDLSNAASGIPGVEGDYSKYLALSADCTIKVFGEPQKHSCNIHKRTTDEVKKIVDHVLKPAKPEATLGRLD